MDDVLWLQVTVLVSREANMWQNWLGWLDTYKNQLICFWVLLGVVENPKLADSSSRVYFNTLLFSSQGKT